MANIPNFLMGQAANLDFSPITNALAEWQQRQQQERQFAEGKRRFDLESALARDKFGEEKRQFGLTYDLRKDEAARARQQFLMGHGLDERRVGLSEDEAKRRRETEFENRFAGLAQAVSNETDPARAAANWAKVVSINPKVAETLQRYGVDPTDHKAGAQLFMGLARGFKDDPKLAFEKTKEGETLYAFDPRTGKQVGTYGTPGAPGQKKLDDKVAETRVEMAQKDIQSAYGAQDTLRVVDELAGLAKDPGFSAAIGPVAGTSTYQTIVGAIPGSGIAGVANPKLNAQVKRLQDQLVIAGGEKMRGLGAQSDADSKRLEQAVGSLSTARSPREFQDALEIIRGSVASAHNRGVLAAREFPTLGSRLLAAPQIGMPKGGAPSAAPAAPQRTGGPLPRVNTPEEAAALPSGTRFIDPNGVIRQVP